MNSYKNVLYVSCLISKNDQYKIVKKYPKALGQQIQKYHRLLAKGFERNDLNVTCLSNNLALNYLNDFLPNEFYEDGLKYCYIIGKGNKIKKYLMVLFNSYFKTKKYFKDNPDSFAVCDVLNVTISLGAVFAAKHSNRKIIGIVTDIPGNIYGSNKVSFYSILSKIVIRNCYSYILLTQQMQDFIPKNKRFIVLEGHVDDKVLKSNLNKTSNSEKKECVYAGSLHVNNGIKNLVEAFALADVPNSELHIFGSGDYEQELRNCLNPKIKYHGVKNNDEVVDFERAATLLINPRPTNKEFTKYSFPSKTMEYMFSGTPLLTTKLQGIPIEYFPYIYLFDDESIEGMSKRIKEILEIDKDELIEKGYKAQQFVLQNKNCVQQARKILDFISKE